VGASLSKKKSSKKSVASRPPKGQRKASTSSSSPDEEQPSAASTRSPPKKKEVSCSPLSFILVLLARTRSKSGSKVSLFSFSSIAFTSLFFAVFSHSFVCGREHKSGRSDDTVVDVEVAFVHFLLSLFFLD
jgi:hypothetical protein